ncbi:MAG: M20/M25/M40 family metallo-hydrolase [Flavobacteriaceae bacterium]
MKKTSILSLIVLLGCIYFSFYNLMPQKISKIDASDSEFSTERAWIPLKEISRSPHYVGTQENRKVREFLIESLKELGLSPEIQQGYVLNEKGRRMTRPANIIAKINGTEKGPSLLIFSHYDSALTPSFGASDAGSGVVTILESIRAYLASGKQPKNDLVILFTDAEEVGLDGAKLFVRSHPLAKNVGLAINFEARGSGGPSSMILETNQGNKNLIQGFIKANPQYPLASSLLYSIYKMLPNDTDSTILREEGDIEGLFFAFIDDHFDYHTAGDHVDNLDPNSLEHQGSYLMSMLHYFSEADLSIIKSKEDYVYTNFPIFKMIAYPFSWVMPSVFIAILLFLGLIFYGFKKESLKFKPILKGFVPILLSLIVAFIVGFYGWSLLLKIYPHYQEILHGFTYNGHTYIAFFVSLSIGTTFWIYHKFQRDLSIANLIVAPLLIWLIINVLLGLYLKGGSYFIIPFYCALFSFGILIKNENSSPLLHLLLAIPSVFMFSPLIQFFPVGLGLKSIVLSILFTVLLFGFLLTFIGSYRIKKQLAQIFGLLAFCFFVQSHLTSDFDENHRKPNSLLYFKDLSKNESYWLTYDMILDNWSTDYLGKDPQEASSILTTASRSKYRSGYTFAAKAPNHSIPHYQFSLIQDTLIGEERKVTFRLIPEKKANVLQLFVDQAVTFRELDFNGVPFKNQRSFSESNLRLLTFYVSHKDSLQVSYKISKDQNPTFTLLEYSFDLMDNPWLKINERPRDMMPKPFVFNDALVVKQKINPN